MRWPRRDTLIPLALGALAFVVAFAQRPGLEVAETKVDLHVAPGSFLRDVLSAWTPSGSLGHVFAGQYGGYLWPMGPFFALGHLLGLPDWVVGRLWIGTALALSAWGMVRLLDALAGRPRGAGHLAGALLYMLNPYVVTYVGRTSITLLATAALPWLLLCVHRGLRDPRGWWWPAAFALVLTSTGGGVNVAVTAWLLLAPALLVVYELGWGAVAPGAARAFAVRLLPVAAVASLWWVAAVLVHARYGLDFLPYTEQPGTIWSTTSLPESLRLLGFWTSYIGVGYTGTLRAFQADAGVYLGLAPVVVATLVIPALCLGSFAWTRRARYAPFFLALVLLGLLVMFVGFPEGAPLRRAATFTYNHVQAVRFLRTSYKAGPLVSLGLAGLGALAVLRPAPTAARRGARRRGGAGGSRVLAAGARRRPGPPARAPARRARGMARRRPRPRPHPAARPARHGPARPALRLLRLGRDLRPDPAGPHRPAGGDALHRPVRRPARGRPAVDDRLARQPAARAARAAAAAARPHGRRRRRTGRRRRPLAQRRGPGLLGGRGPRRARPAGARVRAAAHGARRGRDARAGRAAGAGTPLERADRRPGARAAARRGDGGRRLGGRHRRPRRLRRAADRPGAALRGRPDEAALRAQAARGASFVISDSNRRRVFVAARLRGNTGWTVPADEKLSEDSAQLDPFPRRGTDAQTVALVGGGVASVRADFSPGFAQFPERRPFAALDGDPSTAWLADRALATDRHHLDIAFTAPRDVDHVDLMPYSDGQGRVDRVAVNGREFAVRDGWNRLNARPARERSLSVRIAHVTQPPTGEGGAGGIRELRIPGVRATEALRPPRARRARAARRRHAARGAHLPVRPHHRRRPAHPRVVTGARSRGLVRDQQDGERGWARAIAPPAARAWRADAWVSVAPETPDHVLDAWTGRGGTTTFDGSSRFEGLGRNRASSAFDGDPRRAWIAGWIRSRGAWLQWRTRAPRTIRTLRLERAAGARALPDARARDRRRPPDGAAGRGRRRHDRPARPRCARARCASRSSTPPSRAGRPASTRSAAPSAWER